MYHWKSGTPTTGTRKRSSCAAEGGGLGGTGGAACAGCKYAWRAEVVHMRRSAESQRRRCTEVHSGRGAEVEGAWKPMTKLKIHPRAPEKKRPAKMAGAMRLLGSKPPPRGRLNCCMCRGAVRAAGVAWSVARCGAVATLLR